MVRCWRGPQAIAAARGQVKQKAMPLRCTRRPGYRGAGCVRWEEGASALSSRGQGDFSFLARLAQAQESCDFDYESQKSHVSAYLWIEVPRV